MKRKTPFEKWISRVYGERFFYLGAAQVAGLRRGFAGGYCAGRRSKPKGRK